MLKKQSVLLIESNALDLFVERRFLELYGVAHLSAHRSARSAIEHLMDTERIYDLILIHLSMDDSNGLAFVDRLKSLQIDKKHGKMCIITCSVDPRERVDALDKKIGFISKPLTIDKLREIVVQS